MARVSLGLVVFGVVLRVCVAPASAQAPPPAIRSATLAPDTGVLTIAGEHLGPDVHVLVDGQSVTTLPGATDTRIQAQAPVTVLTTPGTYRLVAFDPVRRAWDGFVVVSAATPAAIDVGRRDQPTALAAEATGPAMAAGTGGPVTNGPSTLPGPPAAVPLAIIEDSGSPYRTALGASALSAGTGLYNTAVGYQAGWLTSTGARNTSLGAQALSATFTSSDSTAAGYKALFMNRGDDNTAVGSEALSAIVGGTGATAVGARALANNTASNNTAVGLDAATSNTTGFSNTALGASALRSTTTGGSNTAVGADALRANTSGAISVAVGIGAVSTATAATANTGLGAYALGNATGDGNTAVGYSAGDSVVSGRYNIHIGAAVYGTATDSNTMRLGLPYDILTGVGQHSTFIAGIRGATVTGGEGVYIDANGRLGSGPVVPAAGSVGTPELADNAVTAAKVAFNYAGSTSEGGAATNLTCAACVSATEVSFAFAGLGSNTFAGTQTISGNLALPASSPSGGNLLKNGAPFLHDTGSRNTFLGDTAGNFLVVGSGNAALGQAALENLSSGPANTAVGSTALNKVTSGASNTAGGFAALSQNAAGSLNTAFGYGAGQLSATGSHNIYLGANVLGAAADANTMRLGLPYDVATGEGQNKTFVAGIFGTQLTAPAQAVFVDANGQLGIVGPQVTTGGGTTTPAANPRDLAALVAELDAQRATIAALEARLQRLEAGGRAVSRRR